MALTEDFEALADFVFLALRTPSGMAGGRGIPGPLPRMLGNLPPGAVAKRCGVSEADINSWLNGLSRPTAHQMSIVFRLAADAERQRAQGWAAPDGAASGAAK